MALHITSITVALSGRVAADITSLEIDGAAVVPDAHGAWIWSGVVPAGTRTVVVTAIGTSRRDTRVVEIGSGSAPVAAG